MEKYLALSELFKKQAVPLKVKPPRAFMITFEECLDSIQNEHGPLDAIHRLRAYVKRGFYAKDNLGCREAVKIMNNGLLAIYELKL